MAMSAPKYWILVAACCIGACAASRAVEASDPEVSVTLAPVRYIFVDGDSGKFRELHWMKDRYTGGLSNFSAHHAFDNGVAFEAMGHALIDQNDLRTDLGLKKDDLGYIDLTFREFRKYFDGNGGVYHLFPNLGAPETDRELQLDIGKLELETGLTLEGWPELGFRYEREHKDGTKSKLSWGEAEETPGGISNRTRNIVPTWMEIGEIVDVFALEASDEIAGTTLSGEQRWEFVKTETLRQETDTATTGTAADYLIKQQNLQPEVRLMTTTLRAERAFQDDQVHATSAYRFGHLLGREFETIAAVTGLTGVPTVAGHTGSNSFAYSAYDTHTWVGNVAMTLTEELSVITSLKAEMLRRDGTGGTNADEVAPLGVPEASTLSYMDSKANRWAEAGSLRYAGVPHTPLYTDLELEQTKLHFVEEQTTGTVWLRDTVLHARRGAWTLGGHFAPWPALNVTAQVRRRVSDQDPDDQRESPAGTTVFSAFVDTQRIPRNEATTRATYKPCRWLRSSFRYQLMDEDYATGVETQQLVKTDTTSHVYTYDVVLGPLKDLLLTGAFSRQTMVTKTPARNASTPTGNIPPVH